MDPTPATDELAKCLYCDTPARHHRKCAECGFDMCEHCGYETLCDDCYDELENYDDETG